MLAASFSFRVYDQSVGLFDLNQSCMIQDHAGNLLICSQGGVIAYNGRQFVTLGPAQGLLAGGRISGIASASDGRLAVVYSDQIRVSRRPADSLGSSAGLSFGPVDFGATRFHGRPHDIVPWDGGFAVLANGAPHEIDLASPRAPDVVPIGYSASERALVEDATGLFDLRGSLWESRSDGSICRAQPSAVRCLDAAQGLTGGPWFDIVQRDGNTVLARSATELATIDLRSFSVRVTTLPDQAGFLYSNYRPHLGLFRAPDGSFATQSSHGIILIGPHGLRSIDASVGFPPGVITTMMTDRGGQFWVQVFGRGLYRCLGFGQWDSLRDSEGLTEGLPWQVARDPGGALWTTTDTGLMRITRSGEQLRATNVLPGASFALAFDQASRVWSSMSDKGIRVLDPRTGLSTFVSVPPVNAIHSIGRAAIGVATDRGLFVVEGFGSDQEVVRRVSPNDAPVADFVPDGEGGILYLAGGALRHHHADGSDASIRVSWPASGFVAATMNRTPSGNLWIGGFGGLIELRLVSDRVVEARLASAGGTPINQVNTILIDHRGWLWVGTSVGVLACNGVRWSLVTTDDGLLSNDVSQGGLSEDADGSIWIATAAGLSHLRNPSWVFERAPVGNVTMTAMLGSTMLSAHSAVPFTTDPLTLQFGTPDFGAEQSIVFRYLMKGVDKGWAETATGAVRYPSIPFGRHALRVYAFDTETHVSSPVSELTIRMHAPWWRRWWAEGGYAVLAVLLVYGIHRLRLRVYLARQHELESLVAERTSEMRAAQIALERLAVTDGLTGLFNRKEAERFTSALLSDGSGARDLAVALVDIDHFKQVNDAHGHLGGDAVLRAVGRVAVEIVTAGELASRMGGEEFLLLLRGPEERIAERIARFHDQVRQTVIVHEDKAISVTCSIGATVAVERDSWESLIGRADSALYRAKSGGRDRIIERLAGPKTELRLVGQ